MGQKGRKRSKSLNPLNEENSSKKLKNERITANGSEKKFLQENRSIKQDFSFTDKEIKKLKRVETELCEANMEELNEEKDVSEFKKKKKSKRKLKEGTVEILQNSQETESDIKVEKKKRKSKEEKSEVVKEESPEDGEENGLDVKKKKKPSKRQLKKEKQKLREKEKREATKSETATKALNYVSKWKHAKSEWKFEKVKQIWLVNNFLDENLVPDKFYPTVLEYFEGCKGMAKDQLVKKSMAIIKQVEELSEESEDVLESTEYHRARQLLQTLPTET